MATPPVLPVEPLTKSAFAPFGEVIEIAGTTPSLINQGLAERFHALATTDVMAGGGQAIISIFRAKLWPRPLIIRMLERHPLGSQAFYPLGPDDWLVVVAMGDTRPDLQSVRCFRATGQQGVNYARNAWHHPLLILKPQQDFLIVDREGPGNNLEEVHFEQLSDQRMVEV